MKHMSMKILFILLAAGMLTEIFAAGTPAGTVIQSRSRLTYTTASGSAIDTVYSAYVSIVVRQVGSFNITPMLDAKGSQSDSTNVDYPFVISNSGNGPDAARLSSLSSKGWVTAVYDDANGDGVLQLSEVSAGPVSQTSSIPADAQYAAVLRVRVPRNEALVNAKDTSTVTIKSNFDSSVTTAAQAVTTVQSADLRSVATGLTVDNPAPNAGSNVLYTLTLTNNGTVAATGVTITDLLSADLTFVFGTASQGTVNGSANPVVWTIGTIAPGGTVTATVTASINNSVAPGTAIGNTMNVAYTVGTNTYTAASNTVIVTAAGAAAYGVNVMPFINAQTREPADTVIYRFAVQNTGSFRDVIEVEHTSSRNYAWMFFNDINNNTILDAGDLPLTNTNASAGMDVDSVSAKDSVRIFARAVVLRSYSDQVKDTLGVTVRSSGDIAKSGSAQAVTTVQEPVVTMELSVFPLGNQPAGTAVTYTIRYDNTGSVAVANYKVIDAIPLHTEYVPNSVKLNGTAVSDNSGTLTITDGPESKTITVNIGTLNAHASGSVEFTVTVR